MKKAEIKIQVETDENHLPEQITWQASDSGMEGVNACKAMMLALWDSQIQQTYKIDLWVKDMPVDQMKLFIYQTLLSMGNTLEKATGEEETVREFRELCKVYARKTGIEG